MPSVIIDGHEVKQESPAKSLKLSLTERRNVDERIQEKEVQILDSLDQIDNSILFQPSDTTILSHLDRVSPPPPPDDIIVNPLDIRRKKLFREAEQCHKEYLARDIEEESGSEKKQSFIVNDTDPGIGRTTTNLIYANTPHERNQISKDERSRKIIDSVKKNCMSILASIEDNFAEIEECEEETFEMLAEMSQRDEEEQGLSVFGEDRDNVAFKRINEHTIDSVDEMVEDNRSRPGFDISITNLDKHVESVTRLQIDNRNTNEFVDTLLRYPHDPHLRDLFRIKDDSTNIKRVANNNHLITRFGMVDDDCPVYVIVPGEDVFRRYSKFQDILRARTMSTTLSESDRMVRADVGCTVFNGIDESVLTFAHGPFVYRLSGESNKIKVINHPDLKKASKLIGDEESFVIKSSLYKTFPKIDVDIQDKIEFRFMGLNNQFQDIIDARDLDPEVFDVCSFSIDKKDLEPGLYFIPQFDITFAYDIYRNGKNVTNWGNKLNPKSPTTLNDLLIRAIDQGILRYNKSQISVFASHSDPKIVGKEVFASINGLEITTNVTCCDKGNERLYVVLGSIDNAQPVAIRFDIELLESPNKFGLKMLGDIAAAISVSHKLIHDAFHKNMPSAKVAGRYVNSTIAELENKIKELKTKLKDKKLALEKKERAYDAKVTKHKEEMARIKKEEAGIKKDSSAIKYESDRELIMWRTVGAVIGLAIAVIGLMKAVSSSSKLRTMNSIISIVIGSVASPVSLLGNPISKIYSMTPKAVSSFIGMFSTPFMKLGNIASSISSMLSSFSTSFMGTARFVISRIGNAVINGVSAMYSTARDFMSGAMSFLGGIFTYRGKMNEIIRAVKREMPAMNKDVLVNLHKKEFENLIEFIAERIREALALIRYEVTLDSYEIVPPLERVVYEINDGQIPKSVDITKNELVLVKFTFSAVGRTYERLLYVPYLYEDLHTFKDGTMYSFFLMLVEKLFSKTKDGVIIKVVRSPIKFTRSSLYSFSGLLSGITYAENIILASIHQKDSKSKSTKNTPCLVHYLLSKYGFEGALARFGVDLADCHFVQDLPDDDDEFEYFKAQNLSSNPIILKVRKDLLDDKSFLRFVASTLYILNSFKKNSLQQLMEESTTVFRVFLGKIIYGRNVDVVSALNYMTDHIHSLDKYLDTMTQKLFASEGILLDDIYDLLLYIHANLDRIMLYYPNNNLYNKRITILSHIVVENLLKPIYLKLYKLERNNRDTPEKLVDKSLAIYARRLVKDLRLHQNVKMSELMFNDNLLLSKSSVLIKQLTNPKSKTRVTMNSPVNRFHPSFVVVESLVGFSSSNPSANVTINPYVEIDEDGCIVKNEFVKKVDRLRKYF